MIESHLYKKMDSLALLYFFILFFCFLRVSCASALNSFSKSFLDLEFLPPPIPLSPLLLFHSLLPLMRPRFNLKDLHDSQK
jgi:hypothetical protein